MPLKTPDEYLTSIQKKRNLYMFGKKVEKFWEHPIIVPSINTAMMTYKLALLDEYQDMMTTSSHLTGERINRFTHIHQSVDDLIKKIEMQRLLGQKTACCFQRCVGFDAANALNVRVVIKLHPRLPQEPADIYALVGLEECPSLGIVKEGDDTFELLKRSDALITVSSTVILEALMMNKECIIANYLAGEARLDYSEYDAVHCIEREEEIYNGIEKSLSSRKRFESKKRLLEDELYKLDGQSGLRAAKFIEGMMSK